MASEQPDIRLLASDSIATIHALWRSAGLEFDSEGRDSTEALGRELDTGSAFLIGFFIGDRLVGAALGTDDGRKGWINRVAVMPQERRTGVGRALIRACEAIFAERAISVISCLVYQDNQASLEMFRQAGYDVRHDIVYLRKSASDTRGGNDGSSQA